MTTAEQSPTTDERQARLEQLILERNRLEAERSQLFDAIRVLNAELAEVDDQLYRIVKDADGLS